MSSEQTGRKNLVVIAGPTGSGKTDVAIELAKRFGTEILSADSRQIYRGMPVGTAQPAESQLREVKHHFIACVPIEEDYNAGRYERDGLDLLGKLFETYDTVIAAGGSGMYIDALCHGMDDLPDSDREIRRKLEERLENRGLDDLLEELRALDPDYYDIADRKNPRRVMRALEVCLQTGKPYSAQRHGTGAERDFGIIKVGLAMPREILYEHIDSRVDVMVGSGLEEEVRSLYPHKGLNALQTVGYREFFDHFDGKISRAEAIDLIKRNSRRYAKRQMTWFGRDVRINWFAPADIGAIVAFVESKISER